MAKSSKAAARRGKPSYVMSIIGVTLVLFLLGIVGWLTINSRKLIQYFKENVEVQVFLKSNATDTARQRLQDYITAQPYTRKVQYTDKEQAKKNWAKDGGEFVDMIDYNILPTSIDFSLKADFVDSAHLANIQTDLARYEVVDEIKYPKAVVTQMQRNFTFINVVLGLVALLIALAVIVLIDNTIRLAMFSNRFLIKTMQMVGATRWFIAKPLNVRAIINGAISGLIASLLVYLIIFGAQRLVPDLSALQDNGLLFVLFLVLILMGISITLFSTYRSVLKYLRMKLDELY